ncbi:hypothetical protein [Embleya sp. NPDC059259]|uniref:hypothetical protein n=1 Tax=unclassified Embleya TaxID=2699296 RepID=UPI0036A8017B
MTTAAVIGIAGLGIIAAAPVASADPTPTPTVTCGAYGLQSGLSTKVCAEVAGDNVRLFGQVGLAGPPSPGSPPRQPQSLNLRLSGNVGGVSLGAVNQDSLFHYSTISVFGVGGTVPCGSTVHGSFAVESYQWPARPVTVDLVLPC